MSYSAGTPVALSTYSEAESSPALFSHSMAGRAQDGKCRANETWAEGVTMRVAFRMLSNFRQRRGRGSGQLWTVDKEVGQIGRRVARDF